MSWVITESVTIPVSQIKRIEQRKKEQTEQKPSFDFTLGQPIRNATTKIPSKYILTTIDNTQIEVTATDFDTIRKFLNDMNKRDLEFVEYIRSHFELKPGTPAFESIKRQILTPSNK